MYFDTCFENAPYNSRKLNWNLKMDDLRRWILGEDEVRMDLIYR